MPDATFETRTVAAQFEMRDDATTGAPIFEGYASVFDTPYNMGPFWEQVDRRAFNRTLNAQPDVRLLVDHEGQPLARTKSGTLQLHADTQGLHARATLDQTDPDVQRLLPKMRRGDLDQMSFSFRVAGPEGDEWQYGADRTLRTLRELSLADQDVSIVTYPASATTSASVRNSRSVFVEQMSREIRSGRSLPQREVLKLRQTVDEIVREARGLTANDTLASLSEAVRATYSSSRAYAYVEDYDDTYVYFTIACWSEDDEESDMFRQPYTLAADGMAVLAGTSEQVRRRSSYQPVSDPDDAPADPAEDLLVGTRNASRDLATARRLAAALSL